MSGPHCDRLSPLSDDLIHHIFSFLNYTTPELCAKTSLISRRFRHLWAHHPSIRLTISTTPFGDDQPFRHVDRYLRSLSLHLWLPSDADPLPHRRASLRSFRGPALRSLSLHLWLPSDADPLPHRRTADRWLRLAAARSVRSLALYVFSRPPSWNSPIPSSIFACHRSLTDLSVTRAAFPPIPNNFPGFRSLRTLHMGLGSMAPDDLADLLDACPAIEKLVLIGCYGLDFVEISPRNSPRLESLFLMGSSHSPATGARVEARNLKVMRFQGDLTRLKWKGSPVLTTANLQNHNGHAFQSLSEWMELVSAVSNVHVLTVDSWFYQFAIPKDCSRGPLFKNLKQLNLDLDWLTGTLLQNLTCSLGECPLLEELYMEFDRDKRFAIRDSVQAALGKDIDPQTDSETQCAIVKQVEDEHEQDGQEPLEDSDDLKYSLQHLKTVTLREFVGSKNEMRLAQFLLTKAVALEEFVVFDLFWRDEGDLSVLFSPITRASRQVQMKLSIWEHLDSKRYWKKILRTQ